MSVVVLLHVFFERFCQFLAETHVYNIVSRNRLAKRSKEPTGEHALELVRIFETAGLLQLRDHALLCLVRRRYIAHANETIGKLRPVKSLEDVFLLEIPKYGHL